MLRESVSQRNKTAVPQPGHHYQYRDVKFGRRMQRAASAVKPATARRRRLATLPRGRFAGTFVDSASAGKDDYQMKKTVSSLMTRPLTIDAATPRHFFQNTNGLNESATLKSELLDHEMNSLPRYSGRHTAIVPKNGFQIPIVWRSQSLIDKLPNRVRLRVTFDGPRKSKIRFNTLYIWRLTSPERSAFLRLNDGLPRSRSNCHTCFKA